MSTFESRLTCPICGFVGPGWHLDVHTNSARCPQCGATFTVFGRCPACGAVGIFKLPLLDRLLPIVTLVRALKGSLKSVCPSCGRTVPYRDIEPVLL